MEVKALGKWLKIVLFGIGVCGVFIYLIVFPSLGDSFAYENPEFAYCFWPWLVFLWISGIPCYIFLALGWKIATNIGKDNSFSKENAKYFKWGAWLAAGDTAYFFIGNIVLLLLNMSHPGITLASMVVSFIGISIAVCAAVLSHLVQKASELKEENDLTI